MPSGTGGNVARAPTEHPPRRPDGGVHFEETIALSDTRYGRVTARVAPALTVGAFLAFLLSIPLSFLAFFGIVATLSGRPIGDIVTVVLTGLTSDAPFVVLIFIVLFVGTVLAGGVMTVASWGSWGRDRVHTRVTDAGIEIDRDGRRLWQPPASPSRSIPCGPSSTTIPRGI